MFSMSSIFALDKGCGKTPIGYAKMVPIGASEKSLGYLGTKFSHINRRNNSFSIIQSSFLP